jgi:molecular chaperone HscB
MTTDPFETLGAERRFDLDLTVLEKRHRELSRALHPDKHAQEGATGRRAALEKAAAVNEAWRVVRDPVKRAEALFRLAGIAVGETNEPKASPDFLMEVMEQREALAEARAAKDLAKVEALAAEMKKRAREAEAKLAKGFSNGGAKEPLLPLLGELRYYKRFLEEVRAIEEEQEEAS